MSVLVPVFFAFAPALLASPLFFSCRSEPVADCCIPVRQIVLQIGIRLTWSESVDLEAGIALSSLPAVPNPARRGAEVDSWRLAGAALLTICLKSILVGSGQGERSTNRPRHIYLFKCWQYSGITPVLNQGFCACRMFRHAIRV